MTRTVHLDGVALSVTHYQEEVSQTAADHHPLLQIRMICLPSDGPMSDALALALRGPRGAMILRDEAEHFTVVQVRDFAREVQPTEEDAVPAFYSLHLEEVCC